MGRLRLIDGGQRKAQGEIVTRPATGSAVPSGDLDGLDDGDTVISSNAMLPEVEAAPPPRPTPPPARPTPPPPAARKGEAFGDDDVDAALSVLAENAPPDAAAVGAMPIVEMPPPYTPQPPQQPPPVYVHTPPPMQIPPGGYGHSPTYPPPGYAPPPAGYAPPSGAYAAAPGLMPGYTQPPPFAMTPQPMGVAAPSAQIPIVGPPAAAGSSRTLGLIVGIVAVLGGGLAIGWFAFTRESHAPAQTAATTVATPATSPSAPAPPAPAPTPAAPQPQPAAVAAPVPASAPPPPVSASADVTSLVHPEIDKIVSPARGDVSLVTITTPRAVKVGDKLFAIRAKTGGGARAAALAQHVAELQGLAKQDPTAYGPFLARARRELEQVQAQTSTTAVTASTAGLVESRVKIGDKVEAGAELGAVVDGRTWLATATIQGATPTANWSCAIAAHDNSHTAACKIRTTEAVDGGTRVVAEIPASETPWLADPNQHARIVLEPLAAR